MRRGVTLVELIFSMVIVAIVFTVVPKIIFASNKTLQLSIKEDGIYNAVSLLGSITKLPWDENSILSDGKVLHTLSDDCNVISGYRDGGFIGSRNCIDSAFGSSTVGQENGVNDFNDIDDYDVYDKNTTGSREYMLSVDVNYLDDNTKEIKVTVLGGAKTGNFKSSFFYRSANLGHIHINKRAW